MYTTENMLKNARKQIKYEINRKIFLSEGIIKFDYFHVSDLIFSKAPSHMGQLALPTIARSV